MLRFQGANPVLSSRGRRIREWRRRQRRGSMAEKVRILVVGVGNMGASHAKAYTRIDGLRDRRADEPDDHVAQGPAGRARRLSALRGFRPGPGRRPSRTRSRSTPGRTPTPPTPSRPSTPAATCSWRSRSRPPSRTPRRWCAKAKAKNQQAGARLHPPLPSLLGEVHRGRPHAGQAAGDAHEPQPADHRARPGTGTRT